MVRRDADDDAATIMHMAANLKSKFVTDGKFVVVPTNEANSLLHKWWKQSLEPSSLQPGLVLEPLQMDLLDHICKRCTGTCPKKKRNPAGFARALSAAVQAVQDVRDSEKPCDFCADPASTKCKGCEYACPLNPLPRILAS